MTPLNKEYNILHDENTKVNLNIIRQQQELYMRRQQEAAIRRQQEEQQRIQAEQRFWDQF